MPDKAIKPYRRQSRADRTIDRVEDVFGQRWLVAEYRPTAHDFAVAIGWPDEPGPRGKTIVLTAALAEYLQSTERRRDVSLPVGTTALKRLRAALDLRFDWRTWWGEREQDLATMTLAEFCARHHCSMGAASQRRQQLRAEGD